MVIRWVGGILAALIGLGVGYGSLSQSEPCFSCAAGAVAGGLVVYGIAWAVAWVLEGFARE
jgi:hypothetical protein